MRILIVDDNKDSLYILEFLLKGGGYEVVSAGNGAEALEKLRTESIDMIISDILMPVMDGFKFCKEVKKKDELKNIPFIFYTATFKDERDEKLASQLGADKYILKPAESEELIKIIQGMLRDVEEGKFEPMKPAFAEEKEILKLYSERLVNKLEKKMLDLEKEITVRKDAEKRIEHLNLTLRAVRNVNQLIVRERDRDHLIQGACRNFIKNRGFYSAWIAVVDESRRLVTAAEAGLGKAFQPLLKNLKQGNLPYCMRRVLAKPGVLTIKDPVSTCSDCSLANIYKERGVFSSRLEHDGKIYGILTISFPLDYFLEKIERSLFEEVAGDIAYALHHIELEEEHKKAEEALKKSEVKYRTLIENLQQKIFLIDKNFVYVSCNEHYARDLKIKPEKIIGKTDYDFYPKQLAEKYRADDKRILESGETEDIEEKYLQEGRETWVHTVKTPVKDEKGTVVGILGIFWDITEKKRAADQIRAALKEKEVLLQEVHHRVKNNMQIISSLFNLQSGHIKDKQALEIFKSSQNRVRSMALIHERLYKSKDMARVDFAEYTQGLTGHLLNSYGINPDVIKLYIDIKDVFLDINTAIPCSLIINELVSNSLKHAFPEDKKGEIKIAIHPFNKDVMEVIVSDNGVGLPKGMDFRKTDSLGLHLVNLLAGDQLHGDIKLDRTKGTSFHIRFKVKR
jgi:PAS domain S-box-containing protein